MENIIKEKNNNLSQEMYEKVIKTFQNYIEATIKNKELKKEINHQLFLIRGLEFIANNFFYHEYIYDKYEYFIGNKKNYKKLLSELKKDKKMMSILKEYLKLLNEGNLKIMDEDNLEIISLITNLINEKQDSLITYNNFLMECINSANSYINYVPNNDISDNNLKYNEEINSQISVLKKKKLK